MPHLPPPGKEEAHITKEKSSHKDRADLILPLPSPPPPRPALPFPRCAHLVMVGAELWMNSVTVPDHPSQLIGLWQRGLSPDGESSVQMAFMHGKPESLGDWTTMARASAIPTQLQLTALNMRKALCDLTSLPQTLVWPHLERQPPRGMESYSSSGHLDNPNEASPGWEFS